MKKVTKIFSIFMCMLLLSSMCFAQTMESGVDAFGRSWPYYIAVALITSSFVTFSLIILTTVKSKKKKITDEIYKKYLIGIAIIQLIIVGIVPIVVLVDYFNYKPFRHDNLVSTVWSEKTNINMLEVRVFDKNRTPEKGVLLSSEEDKLKMLKILANIELKPKGIPQLVQRQNLETWYGRSVEIKNIVTNAVVVFEFDSPYCCINNVEYKPKDTLAEKDFTDFIDEKIADYMYYVVVD